MGISEWEYDGIVMKQCCEYAGNMMGICLDYDGNIGGFLGMIMGLLVCCSLSSHSQIVDVFFSVFGCVEPYLR